MVELGIKGRIIANYLRENQYFKSIKDIDTFVSKLDTAYPCLPIVDELQKMDLWLFSNPKRLKKDYRRFIVNWLNKIDRRTQYGIK